MPGKKALLIGLNYPLDARNRLYGCVNDVKLMSAHLTNKCGFKPADVTIVSDEFIKNIPGTSYISLLERIYDLAIASWRENLDLVVFHYSGHGTQMYDITNDEKDGRDEGIVPTDFAIHGPLIDDTLNNAFMKFNPKTRVICVMDCCHSGSILDLPLCYDNGVQIDSGQKARFNVPTGPNIIMLSGCRDPETSADAFDAERNMRTGALTSALLAVLQGSTTPVPAIALQKAVNEKLKAKGFTQYALLASSKPIMANMPLL